MTQCIKLDATTEMGRKYGDALRGSKDLEGDFLVGVAGNGLVLTKGRLVDYCKYHTLDFPLSTLKVNPWTCAEHGIDLKCLYTNLTFEDSTETGFHVKRSFFGWQGLKELDMKKIKDLTLDLDPIKRGEVQGVSIVEVEE